MSKDLTSFTKFLNNTPKNKLKQSKQYKKQLRKQLGRYLAFFA